jgi:hypothetical protein
MIYFTLVVIIVNAPGASIIQEQPIVQEQPPVPRDPGLIYRSCDQCSWSNGYESEASAKMGLGAHTAWCKRGRGRKLKPFG